MLILTRLIKNIQESLQWENGYFTCRRPEHLGTRCKTSTQGNNRQYTILCCATIYSKQKSMLYKEEYSCQGVVTQREKLSITDRNQQLFKMLIDQQNAFMSTNELSPATTVQEVYSQEQTESPAKDMQIPRFGKRALRYQRSKKAHKKFRSAAELGLSLD